MGKGRLIWFRCRTCGYVFKAADSYKKIRCAILECNGTAYPCKEL